MLEAAKDGYEDKKLERVRLNQKSGGSVQCGLYGF